MGKETAIDYLIGLRYPGQYILPASLSVMGSPTAAGHLLVYLSPRPFLWTLSGEIVIHTRQKSQLG